MVESDNLTAASNSPREEEHAMESIEKQHERADRRLSILVLANLKRGFITKQIADMSQSGDSGVSQRTVQEVIRQFKDRGYNSLYPSRVVEEDKIRHGRLVGVTKYYFECDHELDRKHDQ